MTIHEARRGERVLDRSSLKAILKLVHVEKSVINSNMLDISDMGADFLPSRIRIISISNLLNTNEMHGSILWHVLWCKLPSTLERRSHV
jgi:hypothetical protein